VIDYGAGFNGRGFPARFPLLPEHADALEPDKGFISSTSLFGSVLMHAAHCGMDVNSQSDIRSSDACSMSTKA
jgi:hypothetical protein